MAPFSELPGLAGGMVGALPQGGKAGEGTKEKVCGSERPQGGGEGRVSSHKKEKRIQDSGKMQEQQQLEGSRSAGFLQPQGQPCRSCLRQGGRGGRRVRSAGGLRTSRSCRLSPGNLCTTSPKLGASASRQSKAKDSRAEPAIVPPSAFRCPLELMSWGLLVFIFQLYGYFPRARALPGEVEAVCGALANKSQLQPLHCPAR